MEEILFLLKRNRLQQLFLKNKHSYKETFDLSPDGLIIKSTVGGEMGIDVWTNILFDKPLSWYLLEHFKSLEELYNKEELTINQDL